MSYFDDTEEDRMRDRTKPFPRAERRQINVPFGRCHRGWWQAFLDYCKDNGMGRSHAARKLIIDGLIYAGYASKTEACIGCGSEKVSNEPCDVCAGQFGP